MRTDDTATELETLLAEHFLFDACYDSEGRECECGNQDNVGESKYSSPEEWAAHVAPLIREHIAQLLMTNAETRQNEWEAIAVRSAARIVRGTP